MEVASRIKEVVSKVTNCSLENIHMDSQFLDLSDGDSLRAMEVLVKLSKEFGMKLPPLKTVREMVEFIEAHVATH